MRQGQAVTNRADETILDLNNQKNKKLRKDKKSKGNKHYLSLGLLVFMVLFVIQFATVLVALAGLVVLVQTGVITVEWIENLNTGRMILLLAAVDTFIGFVVVITATTIPLRPVSNLILQMNRLASGDFQARLKFGRLLTSHPAFAELTDSFNKMAEELGNTEMLRNDFINNFSHEFKTPIVSVAGFAKVLKRGGLTPEQQAEYLNIIEAESLRLSYMATNVLNLTRIENQSILTNVSRFNLSEQIRSCILLLEHKWAPKELEWKLDFGEHEICGNEELLKQVWINLIDNAVKFSAHGDIVEIRLAQKEQEIRVSVINSGPEIPAEAREKIFNKFYQADESHSSEGNGVGLAIVKRVAQLHGGRALVRSQGGITEFTVELPCKE
ncbi:MAG: HAMP domain-containing histidine kinase [Lachnospiraceae bacterium]|jgi:signal transduction histidine kinase|nr:HAMP domain-containing histidine kinase [Lachnospiraceae bacterium]